MIIKRRNFYLENYFNDFLSDFLISFLLFLGNSYVMNPRTMSSERFQM